MTVLSKYEIDTDAARTFQTFRWVDMPGARLPENPDGSSFYSDEALEVFRLSSKSHWDLPIDVDGETVHLLASHPTPPVFDGPEDRNGLRNADEIRFWADYVEGQDYFYDDQGRTGGLDPHARFVIVGDQNSDPFDGDSFPGAAQQLLDSPLIQGSASDPGLTPSSEGGPEAAAAQGGANDTHAADPAFDTADFGEPTPGNLRADYALPSVAGLRLDGAQVFWPTSDDPLADLLFFDSTGDGARDSQTSDHRLVWVDVTVLPKPVPLPAPLLLLGAGLAGLGLLRRARG